MRRTAAVLCLLLMLSVPAAAQQSALLDDIAGAVAKIRTWIAPDGRTVSGLGRERTGSGILIDDKGLILTIGYLMVEAQAAEVTIGGRTLPADIVGYDHETGFGLLRASEPPKQKPLAFGTSADLKARDPVLVAAHGGIDGMAPAQVVAKREFAGGWEYLLDEAIFTSPPHPAWSGAALVNREGKLVGVGSLVVGDAAGDSSGTPGNMFVPINRLPPILAAMIADGRASGPAKPWLGMTTEQLRGRLFVTAVTPAGPADQAGVKRGDLIVAVNGDGPKNLADFYRKVWAQGPAGTSVPLDILQGSGVRRFDVKSVNRMDHLKLKSTF